MYRETELSLMVRSTSEETRARARDLIEEALRRAGGNGVVAAKELGVHRRTLGRWMIDLELEKAAEAMRQKARGS